jgi:DNA-binding protein YbaB
MQQHHHQKHHQSHPIVPFLSSSLFLFSRWGGGPSSTDSPPKDSNDASGSGVDQVMQSMQSFKANQRLGSATSGILQELTTARVEGRSEDGKVRVIMNGKQFPVAVQVGDDIDLSTLNTALVQAMQDAHSKSVNYMESKMKTFYEDLGLPNPIVKK